MIPFSYVFLKHSYEGILISRRTKTSLPDFNFQAGKFDKLLYVLRKSPFAGTKFRMRHIWPEGNWWGKRGGGGGSSQPLVPYFTPWWRRHKETPLGLRQRFLWRLRGFCTSRAFTPTNFQTWRVWMLWFFRFVGVNEDFGRMGWIGRGGPQLTAQGSSLSRVSFCLWGGQRWASQL